METVVAGAEEQLTKKKPLTRATRAKPEGLCVCGLSSSFPNCDGEHLIARTRDPTMLSRCGVKPRSA